MKEINKIKSFSPTSGYPPLESILMPPPPVEYNPLWDVPDASECRKYWNDYGMLENIKAHSTMVAKIAISIARIAKGKDIKIDIPSIQASAMLHDIAKSYCIRHGGNHSQLGSAWVMRLTHNPVIAMGVLHHVFWPFKPEADKYFLPLVVSYADKRVMHDKLTSLEKRFGDLSIRYGRTEKIRERIQQTYKQSLELEKSLGQLLGVDLDEHPFDCGRLV